jgi:uncharacterized protein (TIGR00730 family)
MKRVCVFCGSSSGNRASYARAARATGRALAARRLGLVFGGSAIGLMGVLADEVLEAGGEAVGVIPRSLERKEIAHRRLTRLHVVATMHERKARMARLADAFVALPGGLGTLEELTEALTWAYLGIHRKPTGLLDVGGYWRPLIAFLDHAVDEGVLRPEHRRLVIVDRNPGRLLDRLESHRMPDAPRWVGSRES